MAPWLHLAALPASLVTFLATSTSRACSQNLDLRWPYNLPPDAKYYPEDETLVRRDIEIQHKLHRLPPNGVRKLSGDAGEKFYLEYWGFEHEQGAEFDGHSSWTNVTSWTSSDQPIRIHSHEQAPRLLRRLQGWHLFSERAFQCPAGTSACTSVDRPDSCCAAGYTCQLVQETSSSQGDVGCCPSGQTCGDALSTTCASGYILCPNNPGGGCCMPGYACYDVGCVQTGTATVLTSPAGPSTTTVTSYTTITPLVSIPSSTISITSTTVLSSSTSSLISSVTPVPPLMLTVTSTVTMTSSATLLLTCSTGFRSCPASLGGGCCPTDRACGSVNCPALSTTTTSQSSGTPEPPVRPTSLTTTIETTTTIATQSTSPTYPVTGCPTGFYACSAYYQGGCCQIGRNCDKTSCPAVPSTTLVSGSSLTIAAPTGSGITAPASELTGSCATGWTTCAPNVGGGCCPSGYVCGSASCSIPPGVTSSLGVGAGGEVGKEAPTNAGTRNEGWIVVDSCWIFLAWWATMSILL